MMRLPMNGSGGEFLMKHSGVNFMLTAFSLKERCDRSFLEP